MRINKGLILAALLACPAGLHAQSDTLSLKECIELGIANNLMLQNSRQTIYTGIDITNRMVEISRCSYKKAREDLMVEIAKLYYLIQTTDEQIRLTRNNIIRLEEFKEITHAFYDNDIVLEVDVKRVSVNL